MTVPGTGGLPKLVIAAADGARAEVYLHGAHVTSWMPARGEERIFLSPRSEFSSGKAIRGGVPVIFPQFDREGPLPRHGFARVSPWEDVAAPAAAEMRVGRATLRLSDSAATRAIWPQAFVAELTVTAGGSSLELTLRVTNTGDSSFQFTGALHTYVRVGAIETVAVEGLAGVSFRDKVAGGVVRVQAGDVHIEAETDRVYLRAPDRVVVREPARALAVEKSGFPDVVTWNPWEKAASLSDLEPDGYRRMLCVEAAAVSTPIHVDPGRAWTGVQRLTAL